MKWNPPTDIDAYMHFLGADAKPPHFVLRHQLRRCSAWVLDDVANGRVVLQSYSTVVSVGNHRLGKWSTTTSKHQSWFERDL